MNGFEGLIILPAVGGPSLAVPGPYWLFTILHWLLFTLHLIAMDILFGGLLLLLLVKTGSMRQQLFPAMTKLFPTIMAATITLGVAPLLFLQVIYGKFFYSASIVSGYNWFLIVPVVIIVYCLLYLTALGERLSDTVKPRLLLLAVIGLVYISYTFTMISDLAEKPHLWAGLYLSSPAGLSLNPSIGETIFRWLHMVAGAAAVAGVFVQLLSLYNKKVKGDRALLKFGGRMFMMGISAAAIMALIYLITLDSVTLKSFLLSPGLHAIIFAVVLNIIALVLTFKTSSSESPHMKVWTSAVLVFIGVFCMVIARHILRRIFLAGHFDAAALEINPQWSVFTLFFMVFIAGMITLYWMLRKYFTAQQ
jgi:hypothetical protein